MAGFIRRFRGHDAARVARTAIEVAACQQRNDLVPDGLGQGATPQPRERRRTLGSSGAGSVYSHTSGNAP